MCVIFGYMSLMILSISSAVACGKSKVLAFTFDWFLILVMVGLFLYSLIMFLTVLESSPVVLGGIPGEC